MRDTKTVTYEWENTITFQNGDSDITALNHYNFPSEGATAVLNQDSSLMYLFGGRTRVNMLNFWTVVYLSKIEAIMLVSINR